VLLLITQVPTISSFFSGPWVAWPAVSGIISLYIGLAGIRAGMSARSGKADISRDILLSGWVAIGGAAPFLGGLIGFIGGALLVASASGQSPTTGMKKA